MPGVDPVTYASDYSAMRSTVGETLLNQGRLPEEPAFKCYVTDSCDDGS